jgi:hypothetical protein
VYRYVAELRRDVCYGGGGCALGNYHNCVHADGYVLCDGCDKPFHIRCTDILAVAGHGGGGGEGGEQGGGWDLDIDADWFCRPGCPGDAPRQIAAVEEVEENRGGGTPGDHFSQGETTYWAKRAQRYKGVSWDASKQKWMATGWADGATAHMGYFDDEDEGARAYNAWAEERGKALNVIGDGDKAIRAKDAPRVGRGYTGVSWKKGHRKWQATGKKGGVKKHLGYFDDENEGARAYNRWAERNGKPLNVIREEEEEEDGGGGGGAEEEEEEEEDDEEEEEEEGNGGNASSADGARGAPRVGGGGSSKYTGVIWFKTTKKWRAKGTEDGVQKHLGYFDDENEAAQAYNHWAAKNGKPLNVIGDGDTARRAARAVGARGSSSSYTGVSWMKKMKKWQAYGKEGGEKKHLGLFDDENEAAQVYNRWAKENGKPLNVITDGAEAAADEEQEHEQQQEEEQEDEEVEEEQQQEAEEAEEQEQEEQQEEEEESAG